MKPLHRMVIVGGGTGGHLFPGLAVAEEMQRRYPSAQITFVGTARGIEVRAVPRKGFELALLPVHPLRGRGVLGLLAGLGRLPTALWSAWRLLRRLRPDVAVGVGGYAAGPGMLAARLSGCPCVILEQNAVAGVTNRLLGRVVHKVVAAMPSRSFAANKVVELGNPVRADLMAVRAAPYTPAAAGGTLRLLVVGGSQGAHALNEAMLELVPLLANTPLALSIFHQTGSADVQRLAAAYAAAGMQQARATAFIEDMATAYAQADLVLCRAGASTLAELTVCGRPSILVPYPAASDDHQSANARLLAASGAALWLPQPELTAAKLLSLLLMLAGEPARLLQMAGHARAAGRPQATRDIADLIDSMVQGV